MIFDNKLIVLIIILLQLLKNTICIKRQDKIYQGRFTRDIKNYELLVPHKINVDGKFLSFSLINYYQYNSNMKRKKRDINHPDLIHLNLYFNNFEHHIKLWPNHNFLTSETITEYYYPGGEMSVNERKMKRIRKTLCYYTGFINEQNESSVAVSLCDGIAGYIKTENGIFFIEPVKDFGPNNDGHHLHIIHTTNDDDDDDDDDDKDDNNNIFDDDKKINKNCGTNHWELGWAKAFKRYFNKKNVKNIVRKRSTTNSFNRYLEILVVADKKFMEYHKDKDYENYILTIMNMVSDFYHDASVGNQMDIVVVRIIYLDENVKTLDLTITPDSSETLKSFCKWQNDINPKNIEHPQHHDISILLTRHDICSSDSNDVNEKNCDLLGLAYMASACTPTESCAINEDKGLILGVVVAHEIGHIVGCGHDDEEDSGCSSQANDKSYHVMSPYVKMATSIWSTCSKKFMTELFENKLGECLIDEPQESSYKSVEMMSGAVYDADYQCGLLFTNSTHCPINMDKFCEKLFCKITADQCRSNGEPPADGTKCGHNKWCYKQKCILIGQRPKSIAGGWGKWNQWTDCSRLCGGGVQISERNCDNPKPMNGGLYCLGERKRIKICNSKRCPKNTIPFRAQQCSEFNKIPRNGKMHKWTPYYPLSKTLENSCVLYCINEMHIYSKLEPRAKDGTPCKSGTNYMCITGECHKVGCDWILDSNAIEDKCGICNGDGTNCHKINGVFKEIGKGYTKIITIPRGARNIKIEELSQSDNTIAISNQNGKLFYLNGDRREESDGEKSLGNNLAIYMHSEPNKEDLEIPGPINQNLIFYVMFFKNENVGYNYEYYLRNRNQNSKRKNLKNKKKYRNIFGQTSVNETYQYHWEFVEWNECSLRCDSGETSSIAVCVNDNKDDDEIEIGEVSDDFCMKIQKPEKITKVCNKQECKLRWHVGEFSECTGCEHKPGFQMRRVWCARESPRWEETDTLTSEEKCIAADGIKPFSKQLCTGPCPKTCRKIRSTDSQLDHHGFKELYKSIDILLMEPEGIIFGMLKSSDDNSLNQNQGSVRNSQDSQYDEKLLQTANQDEIEENLDNDVRVEEIPYLTDKSNRFIRKNDNGDKKLMFLGNYIKKQPHIYNDLNSRIIRDSKCDKDQTIVQDKIPKEQIIIEDVDIKEFPQLQNLSDLAYEKLGDKLSGTIDLSHEKVYTGNEAICILEKEKEKEKEKENNKSIKTEK